MPVPIAPPQAPQAAPAPPPRKHRLRRFLVGLAVLLILLGVLLWAAPGLAVRTGYVNSLLDSAAADVQGKVSVGSISLAWFSPVEITDLSVTDPDGKPVLSAPRVTTTKTLLELALHRADVGEVRVERPHVTVVVGKGSTNVERVFAKYLNPDKPVAAAPSLTLKATDGTAVLIDADHNVTRELQHVAATVALAPSEPTTVKLTADADRGGSLAVDGTSGPAGTTLTATAKEFDLSAVEVLARRFEPTARLGGKLSCTEAVGWKPGAAATLDVNGTASVSGLELGAAMLGPDVVRLQALEVPCKFTFAGNRLDVDHADLKCDAGTASVKGVFDVSGGVQSLVDQVGLQLDADLDLAKAGKAAPKLLRLKPGTELTGGRLTAQVRSTPGADGKAVWAGFVQSTRLEGVQNGTRLVWDNPLSVTFRGRTTVGGLPAFDDLTIQSDVISGRARGGVEAFDAAVNADLTKLTARLEQFVDLGGVKLEGFADNVVVKCRPRASGGGYTVTADGSVTNFGVADKGGKAIREPRLTLHLSADAELPAAGKVRLAAGTATVAADQDTVQVSLTEPIADVTALNSGKASVRLTGDLGRWRRRVGPLVGLPPEWEIGGQAKQATATVAFDKTLAFTNVAVVVSDAVFTGMGVALREPELRVETADKLGGRITLDPATAATTFAFTEVVSETASASVRALDLKPLPSGSWAMTGDAKVIARVDRVLALFPPPPGTPAGDPLRGIARGAVRIDSAAAPDVLAFDADLVVTDFAFGPRANPTWSEPQITLKAVGDYDLKLDALAVRSASVGRPGFTATAKGRVQKPTTDPTLALDGTVAYDLATIQPQLKQYLGQSAQVSGKDTKPFTLAGRVNGGKGLAVAVGGPKPSSPLGDLTGRAAVGWQSLKAYGFDVGAAELSATLADGKLTGSPVEATFGGKGKVRAQPTVDFTGPAPALTLAKGKIVDHATLTPAACADAVGYALPALANAAQTEGTISFDLDENRLPLADPATGTASGTLTLHDVTVSPGPVLTEIVSLLGVANPKLQLAKDNAVPVTLRNGRVEHRDLRLTVGGTPVTTSGSVGLDRTLDLRVTLPVGNTLAGTVAGGQARIQKALAAQTISVTIGGTLDKPELNRKAMEGQVQAMARNALKDVGKDVATDLLDKQLKGGGFLDKFLQPPKR